MLKRKFRLPKEAIKNSKTINSKSFVLKVAENNEKVSRFGFVVSKRVDKRAVVRNRTKRVLRALIEENIEKIKPGLDFLVIVKNQDKDIKKNVEEVFQKNKYYI